MELEVLSEELIDKLAFEGYVSIENFISNDLLLALLEDLNYWQDQEAFKLAGIGKLAHHQIDNNYRKDKIKWINPEACRQATANILQQVNLLMEQLNRQCFLSLKDFESHYAIYEKGDYYKRHIDQFSTISHRILSFVLYLNQSWQPGDGGELIMYLDNETITIPPMACRLILFKSHIPHEVLPVNTQRFSITGWMKDQINEVPFL